MQMKSLEGVESQIMLIMHSDNALRKSALVHIFAVLCCDIHTGKWRELHTYSPWNVNGIKGKLSERSMRCRLNVDGNVNRMSTGYKENVDGILMRCRWNVDGMLMRIT